jgi:hypothetical protein
MFSLNKEDSTIKPERKPSEEFDDTIFKPTVKPDFSNDSIKTEENINSVIPKRKPTQESDDLSSKVESQFDVHSDKNI